MSMSTETRFRIVLLVAILLSLGSIPVAVYVTGSAQDGGRGGALAVALSFTVLFLSRGYGTTVYNILTKEAQEVDQTLKKIRGEKGSATLTPAQKIDALISKTKIDATLQHTQNVYLAWSSGIGTIAWGFGDIPAQWLIGAPVVAPGCVACTG
jgi:hypothetical protein